MVLTTDSYNAAYFGDTVESGGLKHIAGYSNYLEHSTQKPRVDENDLNRPYNINTEKWKKLFETLGLEESQIIELGGATGVLAEAMLEDNFDWTVVDVSDWCRRHKVIPDENFIHSEALAYLQTLGNNSVDAIVSTRFMDCLDDEQVVTLVAEMKRVSRKQIHFIDEKANTLFYNVKTLEQWESQFNWPNNQTTLISVETGQVINT